MKPLRIAIADDELEVREYFTKSLEQKGYKVVVCAKDGRELVDLCRANRPDLLVTDIRMDGLNGIDAMRVLAAEGPIPTIIVSGHYQLHEIDALLGDQVIAFLPKPVKLTELESAIAGAAARISSNVAAR